MEAVDNWRQKEPSYEEVVANNPQVPPLLILKADVCRRGVTYTQAALDLVDTEIHQTEIKYLFQENKGKVPVSFSFRDGSSVIAFFCNRCKAEKRTICDRCIGRSSISI